MPMDPLSLRRAWTRVSDEEAVQYLRKVVKDSDLLYRSAISGVSSNAFWLSDDDEGTEFGSGERARGSRGGNRLSAMDELVGQDSYNGQLRPVTPTGRSGILLPDNSFDVPHRERYTLRNLRGYLGTLANPPGRRNVSSPTGTRHIVYGTAPQRHYFPAIPRGHVNYKLRAEGNPNQITGQVAPGYFNFRTRDLPVGAYHARIRNAEAAFRAAGAGVPARRENYYKPYRLQDFIPMKQTINIMERSGRLEAVDVFAEFYDSITEIDGYIDFDPYADVHYYETRLIPWETKREQREIRRRIKNLRSAIETLQRLGRFPDPQPYVPPVDRFTYEELGLGELKAWRDEYLEERREEHREMLEQAIEEGWGGVDPRGD